MYENRDITVAMKDNDFKLHMHQLNFTECLKPDTPTLSSIVVKDVQFLQRCNIIDYSMLVGQL
jgi:Phosphatidylinositol-4-phosphate 5-Kinase